MDRREMALHVFNLPDGKIIRELDWAMRKVGMAGLTPEQEAEFRSILQDPQEKSAVAKWIAEGADK